MHASRLLPVLVALTGCALSGGAWAGRPLTPQDWYRFQALSDLQIAPDGAAVAYLVTTYDKEADESRSALWSADWVRGESVQLTRGESVTDPRFSPDGRYVSFLAARPAESATQLWLLDRRGGEARAVSQVTGEISAYEWSPDGAHVVLVMHGEGAPAAEGKAAARLLRPLVIDALQFKQDKEGYLTAESRTHLYLLDVRTGGCEALTSDPNREDSAPAFSADGREIAFVSNPVGSDLGRDEIELMAAEKGAVPRKLLTTYSPNHQTLLWSPDGTLLAFLEGAEPKFNAYITDRLAVADVKTGKVRGLTEALDRAVYTPHFAADGRSILFAVEDDGYQYPAAVSVANGAVTHLADAVVVHDLAAAAGHTAVLVSSDQAAPEVYALEQGKLRRLSHHNDALFAQLTLGSVEDIAFKSGGGIEVHGQMVKPPDYTPGRRYPTILWIHGGPNGQDDHSLELSGYGPPLERQFFATHGYV
ncbi:MAG TPA: hypothetical protein VG011_07230, partial [Steroidobacteraceae bacterium]|nr:hypothetical protein [Steroidobacteraceae bacterium]